MKENYDTQYSKHIDIYIFLLQGRLIVELINESYEKTNLLNIDKDIDLLQGLIDNEIHL